MSRTAGTITVAYMNVLCGEAKNRNVLPQHERMPSVYQALSDSVPYEIDVVSLSEVEQGASEDVAQALTEQLGFEEHANAPHANKPDTIHMSVRSPWTQPEPTTIDPEYAGRGVVSSTLGKLAVVSMHCSHEASKGRLKEIQMLRGLGLISAKKTILMGDWNGFTFQQARRQVEKTHTSVARFLGKPRTFPTPEYRWRTVKWYQQPLVGRGYSLDDIYYPPQLLELVDAGKLKADSDHWGLWARFRQIPQQRVLAIHQLRALQETNDDSYLLDAEETAI